MYKIILASESPRRRHLLEKAGYRFTIIPSHISEILDKNLSIPEQIQKVATDKSKEILKKLPQYETQLSQYENFIILSGDTVVVIDNEIIGKPKDQNEAFNILKRLSGKKHQVITAINTLVCTKDGKILFDESCYETTDVYFKNLADQQIHDYIASGEPMDKAGAYGYQQLGRNLVEKISGPEDNVIGFPMKQVRSLIEKSEEKIIAFNYQQLVKNTSSAKVIAVSKKQPIKKIQLLYDLGHRDFAENYAQEALEKKNLLKNLNINWHFIGHLQTNKVKDVVGNFDLIQSVDSLKLAEKIDQIAKEKNIIQKILIQINIANENTKSGFEIDNISDLKNSLLYQNLIKINLLKNIKIYGFMCMPPLDQDSKKYFILTQQIANFFFEQKILDQKPELSMGTSTDYLQAMTVGSTMIRLGTTLFGERN